MVLEAGQRCGKAVVEFETVAATVTYNGCNDPASQERVRVSFVD